MTIDSVPAFSYNETSKVALRCLCGSICGYLVELENGQLAYLIASHHHGEKHENFLPAIVAPQSERSAPDETVTRSKEDQAIREINRKED